MYFLDLDIDVPKPIFIVTPEIKRSGTDDAAVVLGMEVAKGEGQPSQYLYFQNLDLNLGSREDRLEAAARAALYRVTADVEVVYGWPVDRTRSNPEAGDVVRVNESRSVGLYAERNGFARFALIQASMGFPGNTEKFIERQLDTPSSAQRFLDAMREAYRGLPVLARQYRLPGF